MTLQKKTTSLLNLAKKLFLLCAIPLLSCAQKEQAFDVTFDTLLTEMVDRDELPKTPKHAYILGQASSYDRNAKSPDQDWFANKDGDGMIRTEVNAGRTEHVLMDEQGPGAIVRFWSTNLTWAFSNGTLRFYFDGAETPQIEGSFLDILGGNLLVDGILSTKTGGFQENHDGKGYILGAVNLYLPIPYAKSCKVTYEGTDSPFYFIINHRKYNKDTKVQTFALEQLKKNAAKIAAVQQELATNEEASTLQLERKNHPAKTLGAGEKVSFNIEGAQAIREFMVNLEAKDYKQALRSTVVEIMFDGASRVWSPVGDFFCTGYNLATPFETRYQKVSLDGRMLSRWVMPFKTNAEVILHNLGDQEVTIKELEVAHNAWQWDDRSMYFNANWQLYAAIPSQPHRDLNYISIKGKGKYVGDALSIYNAIEGSGRELWWGEGDEKVYIDGEDFPSIFGTGTEDYYGYAWVGCAPFAQPFLAQPMAHGNRGRGLTVNTRVRALDAMPFNNALHFNMELWHWADTNVDYAPTCFWYGTETAMAVVDKAGTTKRPNDVAGAQYKVRFNDRIEAEGLALETTSQAKHVVYTKPTTPEYSNRSVLLVTGLNEGEKLEGYFYAPQPKTGTLKVVAHKQSDAVFDLFLNDTIIVQNQKITEDGPAVFELPNVSFNKGRNTMAIVAKDNSGKAIAIDYLQLLD